MPVYSSSLLQYARATEQLRKLDLGDIRLAVATGGGSLDATQFVHRRLAVVASLGANLPQPTP